MKVLLFVLALTVAAYADKCEEKCASCPVVERSECLAGVEKDQECGCCDICSRFEGQKCDLPQDNTFKYGRCGDGLECRKTSSGPICHCTFTEIVCGTDNITYSNLCQLMAASVRENLENLEVQFMGPCDPAAKIVTKPEYVRNSTQNNVVLACEAIGYPVPTIRWEVTKANGKTFDLPVDDSHIVVATRGGPAKYQVTGWLQVERLLKRHEGDYTCIATNKDNVDRATARIKVIN